jgi:SAM-dependent methyltransferase
MGPALRTDYEDIAERYDQDRAHWTIPKDDVVPSLLDERTDASIAVLDVGCGTGIYLAAQRTYFADQPVRWFGVDPSEAMLAAARGKADGFAVARATAERLPVGDAQIDYLFSSFVFHHVEDKPSALDEFARVLRRGGRLRIRNMDPWGMEQSWVYRFFPKTRVLDDARFWPGSRHRAELEQRGFHVVLDVERLSEPTAIGEALVRAESRAISQLAILDDESYSAGVQAMRTLAVEQPDLVFEDENTLLTVTASKT